MARLHQVILIAALLPLCWLLMMAVHELGHVLAAWATGARVVKVVLHPLAISRTDVVDVQNRLAVVWGGPLFGIALPLALWAMFLALRLPAAYLLRFFTGFCLVTNGVYLGVGSFSRVGDAGELLRLGSPAWTLWLFGLLTVPAGMRLWNGQGRHFGFGEAKGKVDRWAVYCVSSFLILTLILMFSLSERI